MFRKYPEHTITTLEIVHAHLDVLRNLAQQLQHLIKLIEAYELKLMTHAANYDPNEPE